MVQSAKLDFLTHSDHAMIAIHLGRSEESRGPGLWRFDASLLQKEDFTTKMTQFLSNWVPPPELTNPHSIWEWLKFEVKRFTIAYTKTSHSEQKQHVANLNNELKDLYKTMDEKEVDNSMEIESVRRELREIEENAARKIIFRSKTNWALNGERPSKYFLNLENRRNKEKTLHSIITEEGKVLTKTKDILKEARNFYVNLYQDQESSLTPIDEVQDQLDSLPIPQLSDEKRDQLEAPFTEEELRKAMGTLNANKTPGYDGLPPEFYQRFWHFLARHYCNALDFSLQTGRMSDSQRRGIMTLVPTKM